MIRCISIPDAHGSVCGVLHAGQRGGTPSGAEELQGDVFVAVAAAVVVSCTFRPKVYQAQLTFEYDNVYAPAPTPPDGLDMIQRADGAVSSSSFDDKSWEQQQEAET